MAYYRISRPEFYKKTILNADLAHKLRPLGKRRFHMHRTWMEAFEKAEPLFAEIAKRAGLTTMEIINCTQREVNTILDKSGIPVNLKERIKGFEFIYKENNFILNTLRLNANVLEPRKNITSVSGHNAFPGIVKGKVLFIAESLKKITLPMNDVPKRAVLVTNMTSPNMLSIMKKAVAFVTDEGGMLCHAAIVAREMKKPCIIGTKIATKVLKDGDLVEVDANRGVVRILKRS